MTDRTTVLLVDDHPMFREGIREHLEKEAAFHVIGDTSSALEARVIVREQRPEIVILDVRMPDGSGIGLARTIRQEQPDVKILVLSGFAYEQYVREMMRIGVQGYLLKESTIEELVKALHAIARGETAFAPTIMSQIIAKYSQRPSREARSGSDMLTIREMDVLELLAEGLTNSQIAARCGTSVRTAESHVRNVISKLGVKNRAEAVREGMNRGLLR